MRYANFYNCDLCNGNAVGSSLFIQGCPIHCDGCFNPETWDFNSGKEWTDKTELKFFEYISKPYIKRVSFLGGEPFAAENKQDVIKLIHKIKTKFNDKKIWVFSGYTWEELHNDTEVLNVFVDIDVLVDGRFNKKLKDLSLPFRGSSNQRIIDVQKSLSTGEIILWRNYE